MNEGAKHAKMNAVWVLSVAVVFCTATFLFISLFPQGIPAQSGTLVTTPAPRVSATNIEAPRHAAVSSRQVSRPAPQETRLSSGHLGHLEKTRVADLFRGTTDLHALNRELAASSDPKQLYASAVILDNCAYASKRGWLRQSDKISFVGPYAGMRQQLLNELKPRSVGALCRGFEGRLPSREEVRAAYEKSAEAGDPLGKIWQIEDRLRANAVVLESKAFEKAGQNMPNALIPQSLERASFERIVQAVMSSDPDLLQAAGPLLTTAYRQTQVTLGGEQVPAQLSGEELWMSVACSLTQKCTFEGMRELKNACIVEQACDVADYDSFLRNHRITQVDWPQFVRIRDRVVEAIRNGNSGFFQANSSLPSNSSHFSGTALTTLDRPRTRLSF
jgi:hypothetical protein